ncbi:MAG: alpha-ketoglutarate-dependent dioxygenase AlkB [Sediminimonas sp.]|nr:alpha-ketoglutarate-dependent dioxygenase AlkB [Sediminimonas sp.]MDR9484748.1 alpha-ketoglutarate-dependent dioxygenase AlkB [Sediminimonas sp.]
MKPAAEDHMTQQTLSIRGIDMFQGYLDPQAQVSLLDDLRDVIRQAPLFSPVTPGGRQMSVRMTSAGRYGWVTDSRGYRYERRHPDGGDWPPIPDPVLAMWRDLVSTERDPDCCLVNFYGEGARMGLHQDRDEADFGWPVLSLSLGDEGLFRVGNTTRGGKTESVWLRSGDVLRMGGEARLIYHGIDRIKPGSSTLLPRGGRINLTLRVVD